MSKPTIKEALVLVNQARKAMERKALEKMPKGVIYGRYDCPLANALKLEITKNRAIHIRFDIRNSREILSISVAWKTKISFTGLTSEAILPTLLKRFVEHFDNGEYPSLIEPS